MLQKMYYWSIEDMIERGNKKLKDKKYNGQKTQKINNCRQNMTQKTTIAQHEPQ
jgi:hypothetical protein